jgi:hypothetical protein
MVYDAAKPPLPETVEQLRARIPGWGADLDHADRPAFPREQPDLVSGAHWDFPERQPELQPRERSIEHKFLTPVFGSTNPPKALSGVLRRFAYARYSEGRAAHWLVLLAADRVDAVESSLTALLALRPDNPLTETGVASELSSHGLSSRFGQRRADLSHQPLDPVIVAAPWVAAGAVGYVAFRALARNRR